MNPALCRQISGLDDLARIFFPDNDNHRRAFVALWIEIKYGENQFLPARRNTGHAYGLTARTVEIVRAKLKKMGVIKRISHFNPAHGMQSGWVFSERFTSCLVALAKALKERQRFIERSIDEKRDRHSFLFV